MKCKLHAFGIATCGSESYAGQNPTQQPYTMTQTRPSQKTILVNNNSEGGAYL